MTTVSIIMGIYNCETTLSESIDSLLNQTFHDFEIIMCDDGSTDNTYKIAQEYTAKHNNIIVLRNNTNMGLNYTLNRCLEYSRGKYIARQDGDDISLPTRLEEEVKILEENKDIALVSCAATHFDDNGDFKTSKKPYSPAKKDFIYGSPFIHASCVIRKYIIDEVCGYTVSNKLLRVEDYHLWFKIYAKGYKGINIQTPLYKWRDDSNAYNRRTIKNRLNEIYVRFIGFKMLKLPFYYYIYCFRPLAALLAPRFVYSFFHRS